MLGLFAIKDRKKWNGKTKKVCLAYQNHTISFTASKKDYLDINPRLGSIARSHGNKSRIFVLKIGSSHECSPYERGILWNISISMVCVFRSHPCFELVGSDPLVVFSINYCIPRWAIETFQTTCKSRNTTIWFYIFAFEHPKALCYSQDLNFVGTVLCICSFRRLSPKYHFL